MSRIAYQSINFRSDARDMIKKAQEVCNQYESQGLILTLRQIYYQFVSRDWIPNKDTEYKRLGNIISDARLCGLLDWSFMEDRGRNLMSLSHWDNPADIIAASERSYMRDLWEDQPYYVEVWVEKEALAGVISRTANAMDCPYFACKGYNSQTEMHAAGKRLRYHIDNGQEVVILHLGDHDPSGIDMTRDIQERLSMFVCDGPDWLSLSEYVKENYNDTPHNLDEDELDLAWDAVNYGDRPKVEVKRIALNMNQIRQYNPPPNPAKISDTRADSYIRKYGTESWELDALNPTILDALMRQHVLSYRDEELWDAKLAVQAEEKRVLTALHSNWDDVDTYVKETYLN